MQVAPVILRAVAVQVRSCGCKLHFSARDVQCDLRNVEVEIDVELPVADEVPRHPDVLVVREVTDESDCGELIKPTNLLRSVDVDVVLDDERVVCVVPVPSGKQPTRQQMRDQLQAEAQVDHVVRLGIPPRVRVEQVHQKSML